MKIELNLEMLSVDSFETGHADAALRGTIHAREADPTRNCNTNNPFCQVPSVYEVCPISDVECS
ncbi:MAG TPA: hypothetical protein VGC13_07385 [Longimicrobium sp.]|jgi:hypothetical protein|uniref:hypothetical protein n=1 Tax=Longimicrobium sp. TaxID=2029185 RepID=UPI002ED84FCD